MNDTPSAPAPVSEGGTLTGERATEHRAGYREMPAERTGLPPKPERTERDFSSGRQAADELAGEIAVAGWARRHRFRAKLTSLDDAVRLAERTNCRERVSCPHFVARELSETFVACSGGCGCVGHACYGRRM